MERRQFVVLLGGTVVAWPVGGGAQQAGNVSKVGILALTRGDADALGNALRAGLRELGFVENQNLRFETRSADGQSGRLAGLAAELVGLKVDVIVALHTPCALAAKQATREIPIIATAVGDPIGTGLVASLARPGGNVTGLSNMAAETAGKSVELFRDMLPSLQRVGVLANPADPFTKPFLEQVHLAGRAARVEIKPVATARSTDDLEAAFASMVAEGANAAVVQGIFFPQAMADLAIKYRLPSASSLRSFALSGGLLSYGADVPDLFRRSATFVQKILQGSKPADLPVEQPTKFELTINLKTAKAIGLRIPEAFILRADHVIE
jgi:putative tryptophan/tyrosine transport system substrate-binding protein